MRINTTLVFTFFLSVLFTACNTGPEKLDLDKDFDIERIANRYEMKIPKHMTPSKELHEEANLQFMNGTQETYIIVIDEDKADFVNSFTEIQSYDSTLSVIDNYANVITSTIEVSEELTLSKPTKTKINGMDARLYLMEGKVEGIPYDISYILAYIEGEKNIYAVSAWTLKDRMEKYKETFFQSIKSVKEL